MVFSKQRRAALFSLMKISDLRFSSRSNSPRVQDKVFTPIGETKEVNVDARIISATNPGLGTKCHCPKISGKTSIYRLNVIQIRIPPLRSEKMDIPLLAQYFLDKYSRGMGKKFNKSPPMRLTDYRTTTSREM